MIDFTGYQKQHYNQDALNQDAVACWSIVVPDRLWDRPDVYTPGPKLLAMSHGSNITALDAVKSLLNAIPHHYQVQFSREETPIGLGKALKRMWSPEKLYQNRIENIKKRLKKNDPLFYDQLVDKAISQNPYTLDYYKTRQEQKRKLRTAASIKPESTGYLWINPEGTWLAEYDWLAIREALSKMVSKDENIYQTWDRIAEQFGLVGQKLTMEAV